MNTIHDLAVQGKVVQEIAQELQISRTTVRKYLKHPEAVIRTPRPPRSSKLDPFKEQIKQWGNLLGDEILATALLDRLLHHAEVISINDRSYRMKERKTDRMSLVASPEVALSVTGAQATGVR